MITRRIQRKSQPRKSRDFCEGQIQEADYRALLAYSLNLLAKKSYTEHELRSKLVQRCRKVGIDPRVGGDAGSGDGDAGDLIARILARLCELNYINDARILDDYLEYTLLARPLGKFGFLQKMRQRGIDYAQAELAWNMKNIDEEALARQLVEKRLERLAPPVGHYCGDHQSEHSKDLLRLRKKLASFLAGRGFGPEVIFTVVEQVTIKESY